MTRTFYILGALAAMGLIMFAYSANLARPEYPAQTAAPAAATEVAATPDLATTALDDLAAWPAAAGR